MPLLSLPDECTSKVLSFLTRKSLYKCLFVNRYYCKLSIPIIWREPFIKNKSHKVSLVINTLLACLNEDEISSLVPYAIKLTRNDRPLLFEYGKFVRNIDHEYCIQNIENWLESSSGGELIDNFKVQKLSNVIYHMIMRQGSNLRDFSLIIDDYIYSPKLSTFITYKPGIRNLKSLNLDIALKYSDDVRCHDAIEFLSMVSTHCNSIVNYCLQVYKLNSAFIKPILDIIKLQPLEKILIYVRSTEGTVDENLLRTLEFRSETLKELTFDGLDFQFVDLSSISKLKSLECLKFNDCNGFTSKHHEALSSMKSHLKKLKLWFRYLNVLKLDSLSNVIKAMINSLCGEALFKLSLNIVTLETVKTIKESCPNVSLLHIKFLSDRFLDSIIPLICGLSSLKILHIQAEHLRKDLLMRNLTNYLTSVDYLFLNFYIDLLSFKYFTDNCKANFKKLIIDIYAAPERENYLMCVYNFSKIHNSLKVLGIKKCRLAWKHEELEIINLLKNQGVEVVPFK